MNKTLGYVVAIVFTALSIVAAAFFMPLSSKQYANNDIQNTSNPSLTVTRYALAVGVQLELVTGACDSIEVSTTGEEVKTITVTTRSESDMCTHDLRYHTIHPKVFMLPWQKHLIVKYDEETWLDTEL